MKKAEIEAEILAIVGNRYRVQKLYRASNRAKVGRYAIFTGGVSGNGEPRQISGEMSHGEAQIERGLLIVRDILDLLEPVPEGLYRIDGNYYFDCLACHQRTELEIEPSEFDPATAYCGGSPRCIP
jgi:hypothetical protein